MPRGQDPLACWLLIYSVAAMGLTRVAAVADPTNPALLLLAAIMYVLETLICLYEMDTSRMANRVVASRGAASALGMAAAVAIQSALCFAFA